MDNPVIVHDEDIPFIDDEDDYDDDSRYDTPDTSRIEETSFTKQQPVVRLKQRQKLLHDYLEDHYRYQEGDPENVDLVNPDFFKVEKSKSGVVELGFFDGETWVSLTNKLENS